MTTQVTAPVVGTGRMLGDSNATSNSKVVAIQYDANTVTQAVFIAPFAMRLTGIAGVTRVAGSGGASTFKFYKAPDGIAMASGTLLHDGSFDVVGTAEINQYLTLVAPVDSLTFVAGDRLGMVLAGTPTSAVGTITATFEPVA